jgi:hypothetical protein
MRQELYPIYFVIGQTILENHIVSLLPLVGVRVTALWVHMSDLSRKHAGLPERIDEAEEQAAHAEQRGDNDRGEHMWRALQAARVVEVHAEDARHVGAEAEAAGQHGQHGVRDQQLVAGRVQAQRQLRGERDERKRYSTRYGIVGTALPSPLHSGSGCVSGRSYSPVS